MYLTLLALLTLFEWSVHISTAAKRRDAACKDEKGVLVDWYFVYKLPKVDTEESSYKCGANYVYIVGQPLKGKQNSMSEWRLSERKINGGKSIFDKTLEAAYKYKDEYDYALYSDQPPGTNASVSHRAHAKGVLVMGKQRGFWITHSIPRFPDPLKNSKNSEYPESGLTYAQTALCVSFNTKETRPALIEHLQRVKANIYSYSSKEFLAEIEKKVANNCGVGKVEFRSVKGTNLTAFSKSKKENVDIYSKVLPSNFQSQFSVKSWTRGQELKSDCTQEKNVLNIKNVTLFTDSDQIKWSPSQDHSKWAVSSSGDVVCIGDLNRMESQGGRGGGLVCLKNHVAWKAFKDSAEDVEKC